MRGFNRFYLWGLKMKYHMCLYTVAVVFFKAIVNALLGSAAVDSLTMLEMLVVSMLFASAETAIFPDGYTFGCSLWRTVLWVILANAVYIGAAMGLGWFHGIPVWGGILLIAILEGGMLAMLYAMWLEQKRDTKDLNQDLKAFQGE